MFILLQTEVLKELGTVSNIVQLSGHGVVNSFKGQAWHAILIRPFGRLLATADTAPLYKQAAVDIAAAIGGSSAMGIRHQDVSPFNMVVYQDRVFLTDWSAGRVSCYVASIALHVQCMMIADSPLHCIAAYILKQQTKNCLLQVCSGSESPVEGLGKITMTPLFGAISVLEGFQHSISSYLESLFYSLYHLALGSDLPDANVFNTFAQSSL